MARQGRERGDKEAIGGAGRFSILWISKAVVVVAVAVAVLAFSLKCRLRRNLLNGEGIGLFAPKEQCHSSIAKNVSRGISPYACQFAGAIEKAPVNYHTTASATNSNELSWWRREKTQNRRLQMRREIPLHTFLLSAAPIISAFPLRGCRLWIHLP
jgi:hypothetical protein